MNAHTIRGTTRRYRTPVAVLAVIGLALALPAQHTGGTTSGNTIICPHRGVEHVEGKETASTSRRCGSGISFTMQAPGLGSGQFISEDQGQCPLAITYWPSYNKPGSDKKPNTKFKFENQEDVRRQKFACKRCGFFWLFTCCKREGPEEVVGHEDNYREEPCTVAEVAASTALNGQ